MTHLLPSESQGVLALPESDAIVSHRFPTVSGLPIRGAFSKT